MTKYKSLILIILSYPLLIGAIKVQENNMTTIGFPASEETTRKPLYVGEFFSAPVLADNYFFIRGAISVFGNKWGAQPRTAENLDNAVWDQLLLSYEAFRRGVVVDRKEIEDELTKTLQGSKVEFDWKTDKQAYEKWAKEKTGAPPVLLENQLSHLIQLKKLREVVLESIKPDVSKKEMYEEFVNEYSSLNVELAEFEDLREAKKFYNKVRRHAAEWDKEKEKRPKSFRRPGAVSLEFLLDMWKFPRKACLEMIKKKEGTIYKPQPIYKGYGVFKILGNKRSDKKRYKEMTDSYYNQIEQKKKFAGYNEWFETLKKESNMKVYRDVLDGLLKPADVGQK